ncbi:dTDP-4-dehydrorhamnose 3,5-epimerase [Microvirga massiliensis]|uniref:dTDP-4-dehydrorhamnose 3,5-epimerase n=1 Tax=Microvirga massiliensis TaxID=1033741 RepID=UPI00062B96CF|nr:dTDP-4-dehydrorhamnose 3,5-epimerase [Microvirga massiliensis]
MIEVTPTAIPAVKIVRPPVFADPRGTFSEVYNRQALAAVGIEIAFVQDNVSLSRPVGTVRGLHFQAPPFAQDKLVRVVRGRILDVAVDLRRGSPSFGRHVAVELSGENRLQLLVPVGFAHGFCTLAPDTEVHYKVSAHYAAAHDHGLAWDDPALGIAWPVKPEDALLSDKDRAQPRLADLPPALTAWS